MFPLSAVLSGARGIGALGLGVALFFFFFFFLHFPLISIVSISKELMNKGSSIFIVQHTLYVIKTIGICAAEKDSWAGVIFESGRNSPVIGCGPFQPDNNADQRDSLLVSALRAYQTKR